MRTWCALLAVAGGGVFFSSFWDGKPHGRIDPFSPIGASAPGIEAIYGIRPFPYKAAGLSERAAAAYLLSRFTYGPTPGQVDEVMRMGLENWFRQQLEARLPDDSLNTLLAGYDALKLSNAGIAQLYPGPGELLRMARRDGTIKSDSAIADRKVYREALQAYMQEKGLKPQQELFRQFFAQKILRAAYSNNQLLEVMTAFWFNHFNVSVTKNDCADFIPDYERDVIRPNALGKFSDLLLATAKSPAMLFYLDNFSSAAPGGDGGRGLNENYAREVMELHTLGVDGGYTQHDVMEAARVLTGWTVYPLRNNGNKYGARMGPFTDEQLARRGFVHEGDFLFNANRHDNGEKIILGRHFGLNGGYQEGVDLLEMLAHHTSTAHFICRKIAVRFVSDDPPQSLVDKMAKTFLDKGGNIRQVLITMVTAPEFWAAPAIRAKIKSPFELAISTVRSLHASIDHPFALYSWVNRMGEKLYSYQAPTGFPDKGQYWINTGALLNRMNFGLAIAAGRVPGVKINLVALNNNREPESAQAALLTYGQIMMPGCDLDETVKRLTPMLNDPDLASVVGAIIGSPEYQRR